MAAESAYVNQLVDMMDLPGLLPVPSRQPAAAVVNVSSLLGFIPKQSAPVYCATKTMVHAFSPALRHRLAGTSARVFEVVVPLVDTPVARDQMGFKITPEALVQEVVASLRRDRYEVPVSRLPPALMENPMRSE